MERFELENSREFKAAMELENALNDMCLTIRSLPRVSNTFIQLYSSHYLG